MRVPHWNIAVFKYVWSCLRFPYLRSTTNLITPYNWVEKLFGFKIRIVVFMHKVGRIKPDS